MNKVKNILVLQSRIEILVTVPGLGHGVPVCEFHIIIGDPNNYRGMTLNSCLGKLFCHVLNERITNHLEGRSFIGKEQAGFRKNHRT